MTHNPVTSERPYIVRAIYQWIVDNNCTPHVLVDASVKGVVVPRQFVKNDKIVLNIHPDAVAYLNISNQALSFNGRFGGVTADVNVPIAAVLQIYARENGRGMAFEREDPPDDVPPKPARTRKVEKRPSLKVVK